MSRSVILNSVILNNNAARLAKYLTKKVAGPKSYIWRVYYSTTQNSLPNCQERMRSLAAGFTPGYGSLFSVELNTEEHAIAFYDNLNVYQTPHFRAPLALAYMRRSFTLG